MPQNINLVKMIYNCISMKDTNQQIILYNILAYLILSKMVGNKFSLDIYEKMYNMKDNNSFISIMKNKYNLDVIILDINDVEKIIINNNDNNDSISIVDIIKILNLKTLIYNEYTNYLIDYIPSNENASVLLLSSLFGEFNKIINNKTTVYDINNINTTLSQMEYDYNTSINNNINASIISKVIFNNEDYIHHNIINKSYDIILCNFPSGLRNIIHADCCDKIKRLKIRGTKSEPLILQLIMMSLNNNGKAIILVPNTLLNNDSKQHVDTRNYLINNFNVSNIINCDNNSSILLFEKTGLTKQTTFSQIKDNKVIKLFDISYDKLVKRNYNLYYEKYININTNIISNEKKLLKDIVDIVDVICDNSMNINNHCNYLSIPKFFNDNKKVEIVFDNYPLETDNISLKVKDENIVNQKYFNYYFLYIISPQLITATIGKSRKLDLLTLLSIDINVPSLVVQNKIVEYFDTNYSAINLIKQQNDTIISLKSKYIETVCEKYPVIKLKELCDVNIKPTEECNYQDILCVQRNSKSAGNTLYYNNLINNIEKSNSINTNLYYLNNLKNITPSALYVLLKYNEANLNKLASITTTINLSRTNLENFEIKNIPIEVQENMVKMVNEYDNITKSLYKNMELLINTSIFHLV
uniref:DNA methylase adenine-specific domain-containing protein n=1 Tax=viral metagenome TaxID=1070528 RepID=A0A6C0HX47_9ZZZZ